MFYWCSVYALQCILNVLLECIEQLITVNVFLYAPIVLLESIDLILAHYDSIFDGGLNIASITGTNYCPHYYPPP